MRQVPERRYNGLLQAQFAGVLPLTAFRSGSCAKGGFRLFVEGKGDQQR